ncbi:MAG: hypothetical protein JNL11_19285 [Bdellovibrionaceae bacterium]|nr:hypothetical protein [Pseudobdellovibrionaceae bacterium]
MIKKILLTSLFFFISIVSNQTSAATPDPLWKKHCQEVTADPAHLLKKLTQTQNKISFTNHGGIFNGGVCWWHSRLTRNFQYIAVFDSSLPAPSEEEAYNLVTRVRNGKATTIPGFNNLYQFSSVHYKAVQTNLEEWQITNGGFGLGFLDGLSGSSSVPASELKTLMDKAYVELTKSQKPIFQVLQLPGITAHSWLLINMIPTSDGYQFEVVDSNYLYNQTWTYRNSATHFWYGGQSFVNYTTRRGRIEEEVIRKRMTDKCTSVQYQVKFHDPVLTMDEEVDAILNGPYK